MEEQNVQVEEGISLVSIFKLLLRKVKYLILAVLIGGFLGGALGVYKTYKVDYYGTRVEFYVNPKKANSLVSGESQYGVYGAYGQHVMDNMVYLLSSQVFAEMLILDNEPLPKVGEWVNQSSQAEVALGLDNLIQAATPAVDAYKESQATLEGYQKDLEAMELELANLLVSINQEWVEMYKSGKVPTTTYNKTDFETLSDSEISSTLRENVANYDTKIVEFNSINANIESQTTDCATKKAESDKEVKAVMTAWRQTAKYKSTLSKYMGALSYSYQRGDASSQSSGFARSFINVRISVLRDEKFAKELLLKVKNVVPVYVEDNMAVPTNYIGTNCQAITTVDDVVLTNPSYTKNTAIKYGVLLAFVSFAIACVVLVLIDRADKRLRDPEDVKREFNVPLLGIVPTMESSSSARYGNAQERSDKEVK